MDGFVCMIIFEFTYFLQCSSFICLSWTFVKNTHILNCQTSHMTDTISFFDPYNQEQGHCAIPFPFTECIVYNQHWRITQNLTSKETLLEISGEFADKIDGQWSCHLGRNFESAVTNVKIINNLNQRSSVFVRLQGPSNIKTHEPMWLTCFSNVPLQITFVHFYVNNKLFTTISNEKHRCYSSVNNRQCNLGECWCGEDGKTFHVKHEGFQNGGIVSIRCKVEFEQEVVMSGCRLNNIVNFESPEIRHNKELPFIVSENISLSCFGSFIKAEVQIKWDCHDFKPAIYDANATFIKAILNFQVTPEMNNSVCRCVAFYRNLETFSSFEIRVRKAPILQVRRFFVCRQHDDIEIVCSAIGGMPIIDFGMWTHLHGGYFIRNLQGFKDGNTSTITLKNCSYEDEGEYFCSAWGNDHGIKIWNNFSSNVIIQGKPLVTEKHMLKEVVMKFVCKIYSVPSIIQICWFNGKERINNSSRYIQSTAETSIHRKMYGKIITAKGYSANLTMSNYSKETFPTKLCLIVENANGNVTTIFINDNTGLPSFPVDNLKDTIWVIIGIMILGITMAFFVFFVKRLGNRRNGVVSIYYAAPPNDSDVTTYDTSEPIPNHDEGTNVNTEETSINQPDKQEESDNITTDDTCTEYGYEIPHDYIEVF